MKRILVFGDSHSNVFRYCNEKTRKFKFNVTHVRGATAQGIVNPNSQTNALNIFTESINNIHNLKKINRVAVMLGEVDCGYLIWYRHKKYSIPIKDQVELCITNLFSFVENVILKHFLPNQVIILGAHLPTIKDNTDKKFLAGARSEVNASQIDRTRLTILYNALLKKRCRDHNYNYEDITKETMDLRTGIVQGKYLSERKYDHHLNKKKTYKLWLKKMEKYS